MKKLLAALLALAIFSFACAFAEDGYVGDMQVVNCEEWVSLRSGPSASSGRIAQVPLGEIVTECSYSDAGWIYCCYCGQYGYISADYLVEYENNEAWRGKFEHAFNGITVYGSYDYMDDGEVYHIEACDAADNFVWGYDVFCPYVTELQLVDAFIGGTAEKPLVMAYSAEDGLSALDFMSGSVVWNISNEALYLGGSISHAVDENGTMYIGGYYGPDPVAISMEGEVLWQTNFNDAYWWLYEILDSGDHLVCYYGASNVDSEPVNVLVSKNGDFMGLSY